MNALRILALGAMLAAVSTAAVAFQEQRQGGTATPPGGASSAPAATPRDAGASFTLPGAPGGKASGTEIRIPGLGAVGILPKMDFGLELLYGAADGKSADEGRAVAPGTDDVQIKGTIRRRF